MMELVNSERKFLKKYSVALGIDSLLSFAILMSGQSLLVYFSYGTKIFILYILIIIQLTIPAAKSKPFHEARPSSSPSTPASALSSDDQPSPPPSNRTSIEKPTLVPRLSPAPSSSTSSSEPTISEPPSGFPTIAISKTPSLVESDPPSNVPTLISSVRSAFRQRFEILHLQPFNATEQTSFVSVIQNYTERFAPVSINLLPFISTTCQINGQLIFRIGGNGTMNELDYACTYNSTRTDVSNYTFLFEQYINNNLTAFASDLVYADVPVLEAFTALANPIQTPAPTMSMEPTQTPTLQPTGSLVPTNNPSVSPTQGPTDRPKPTLFPTQVDPPLPPTVAPTVIKDNRMLGVGTIASIVVLGGVAVLFCFLYYYLTWKKRKMLLSRPQVTEMAPPTTMPDIVNQPGSRMMPSPLNEDGDIHQEVMVSPTESLLTNKSLLSAGDSGLSDESDNEYDGTQELQDEFDKYKDQNLEQFRDGVENTVTGMEGVMSAAVTMAHMIGDVAVIDESELWWGCERPCSGVDIEASALFEVCDWLKRNESAPPERRKAFMQEILNKMVTSVKNGVLNADDGSRTIHEAAAVLGLHLAEPLPVTTVLLSGMRKTITADEMSRSIREFGDVDVAAVASGLRGFGIVRFRRQKSVERVMRRYKTGEIVIQDVAVQMKLLIANGMVDSRAPEIH